MKVTNHSKPCMFYITIRNECGQSFINLVEISFYFLFSILLLITDTDKKIKNVQVVGVMYDFKCAFIVRNIKKKDTIALTQYLKCHICIKRKCKCES